MTKLNVTRSNDTLPTLPTHGTHWSIVQAGHAIVHSFHLYLDWAARVLVLIRKKLWKTKKQNCPGCFGDVLHRPGTLIWKSPMEGDSKKEGKAMRLDSSFNGCSGAGREKICLPTHNFSTLWGCCGTGDGFLNSLRTITLSSPCRLGKIIGESMLPPFFKEIFKPSCSPLIEYNSFGHVHWSVSSRGGIPLGGYHLRILQYYP